MSGGFGTARILVDEWLEREVLLKTIVNPAVRAQLTREIDAISSIRSKHVVAIYDVLRSAKSECEGIIYEYLPGTALVPSSFLQGSNVREYLKILYQLAAGISDIHEAKIAHRDIKLANVKHDAENILKIFDFGISSAFDDITNASRGTRIFLAPELFKSPAKITPAIDVYAFGACCWALASNDCPASLAELPPQSTSLVPSIATVRSDLPAEIVQLIDRSLSVAAGDRPTMSEVRIVLHRHLVKGQHRAMLVGLSKPVELHAGNKVAKLRVVGIGELEIIYDGESFTATAVSGDVFVNNQALTAGTKLYESCVIAFGSQANPARQFVELNSSHPEVVL